MDLAKKPKKYSIWMIIKTSFYYFAFNHPQKSLLIFTIMIITLIKNILSGLEVRGIDMLTRSPGDFYSILLQILMFKFGCCVLNFITDFVFEKQLIPYGGIVSKIVLTNMMYSDKNSVFNENGSYIEYFITEGAKSMAKINRFLILSLFSKIVHMIIDLYFIYKKDRTENKKIFYIVFCGTIIMAIYKFFQIQKTLVHLEESNELAYEREKIFAESMDSLHIVKSYQNEDETAVKYYRKSKDWKNSWLNYRFTVFLNDFTYLTIGAIFRISITWFYAYTHKDCKAEDVLMVLWVTTEILKTGTNLAKINKDILESIALADVVLEYLSLAKEEVSKKMRVDNFSEKIEVKGVTYSARGKVVFSNVDMVLKKGDKAALYGRNGVGKSSIFKILLNFDDYDGSIAFDGIEIRSLAMCDYRKLITFVPQDTKLFDESIYYNLTIGTGKSFAEVVEECKKLNLHDKIMALPNGYNTIVGEGGKNINGGLRQKIFYGRAFLRDTPIYLFDEPTNNLDKANSEFLIEYINDPKYANKTFLVICHDMEIVNRFPKIYKFDENKIILEKE